MDALLKDIICFRDDKLFEGAVDISWYFRDRDRAQAAAASFVFHGPRYHGVRQKTGYHEHRLTDTATFAYDVLRQACQQEKQPFKLAVAGYGTGKSHLALALAEILHAPNSVAGQAVLAGITAADEELGQECRILLNKDNRPSLVIPLNGMNEFALMPEMYRRTTDALRADGLDCSLIEDIRPRFSRAANLLKCLNQQLIDELCEEAGIADLEGILSALRDNQDETIYKIVAQAMEREGLPLDGSQSRSMPEFFQMLSEAYCGDEKPYKNVVILFDEFGKYLEFAIGKPYIAGTNSLQELFESVQGCNGKVSFIGFIQFELKSYIGRLNAEYRNEAQRYITRYDNADKIYLSTNFETLIANLIEKKDSLFIERYISSQKGKSIETIHYYLQGYFPATQNSVTWQDKDLFERIIVQGGWPLSAFALWFLCSLAAGSRYLQGRSALSLLREIFFSLADCPVDSLPPDGIPAVTLLTPSLHEELISSESNGNQGSIANALATVLNRHGDRLNTNAIAVLKSIVIADKLHMHAKDRDAAINGLTWICGLAKNIVQSEMHMLQEELNLVGWDDALCCFDIHGDAVPRAQFLAFLRQRRLNEYDEQKISKLFISKIDELTDLLSKNIDTDFGAEHKINTREWFFSPLKTNLDFVENSINISINTWKTRIEHDKPKGSIIYCYCPHDISVEEARNTIYQKLKKSIQNINIGIVPILIVVLCDNEYKIGEYLAEYDIIKNLNTEEKGKYANLIKSHEEKLYERLETELHRLIKEHIWIAPGHEELPQRLKAVGTLLFEKVYNEAIPFPMDGFAAVHGNGPTTAYDFARRLFNQKFNYDEVQIMASSEKNRAIKLFKNTWSVFSPSGSIQRNPEVFQKIFKNWDVRCKRGILIADMFSELVQPPYGMNNISALLAIGIYFSGRISLLYVKNKGNDIPASQWGQEFININRKKIDKERFGQTILFLSEESPTQWSKFFEEWDNCSLYTELSEFLRKGESLRKTCGLTTKEAEDIYFELAKRSENAIKEIDSFNSLENKAESQFEQAEKHSKFELYLASAVNFGRLLSKIEKEPECWPQEYYQKFEYRYGQTRQKVEADFDQWLSILVPSSYTVEAIAKFNQKADDCSAKLRALHFDVYADTLQKESKKLCSQIEILEKYKIRKNEAQTWLERNKHEFSTLSYVSLRKCIDIANDFSKTLDQIARNKPLEGLGELREQYSEHIKALAVQRTKLEKRMADALNPSLQDLDDIQKHQSELTQLEKIFSGQDARDIIDLKKTLDWVLSSWQRLRMDSTLDKEMLQNRLDTLEKELTEQVEENELGLDVGTICDILNDNLMEYRSQLSARWIADAIRKCEHITSLSTDVISSLYNWLQTAPVYLTEKDHKILMKLRDDVYDHLVHEKMNWLIQEFSKLSREEQRQLLAQLNTLMKNNT